MIQPAADGQVKPKQNAVEAAENGTQECRYYIGERARSEVVEPNGTLATVGAPQRLKNFVWQTAKGDPDARAPTVDTTAAGSQQA